MEDVKRSLDTVERLVHVGDNAQVAVRKLFNRAIDNVVADCSAAENRIAD